MFVQWITFARKWYETRRYEHLSRAGLEAHKLMRFRALARLAKQRSPYYAQIIESHRIDVDTCVPADFPVLTKSALMANFDQIVTERRITKRAITEFLSHSTDPADLLLDRYHVLHTSGSSGEVGYFVYSQSDWLRGMMRGGNRRRLIPKHHGRGRLRVVFYGATGGHFTGVSIANFAVRGLTRWFVDLRVCEINSPLPDVIAELNSFQPHFIAGHTTALKTLAEKQREGSLHIAPSIIDASGETVTEADRQLIGGAFGCEVFNSYGCTEHLMMGVQRPGERHMTLYDEDLIFEPFADHTLVTNLFNEILPLIRYRMSDILRPVEAPSAARPYLAIESVIGRAETPPQFVNEHGAVDSLSPHTVNEIFVKGVARFQMQLVDHHSFRFLVCLDPTLPQEQRGLAIAGTEKRLREILAQKEMSNVRFEVRAVDELPVNPLTRKFQLIVQARPCKSSGATRPLLDTQNS